MGQAGYRYFGLPDGGLITVAFADHLIKSNIKSALLFQGY